jgi:hypothetical protein
MTFILYFIDLTVTLTSTAITISSTAVPVTPPRCFNGGNFVDNICNCPSGYDGLLCENKSSKKEFFFVIFFMLILLKMRNYAKELLVKIEVFVLFEIQMDLMNRLVSVDMLLGVNIAN